jgi:hypothetical protein
MGLGQCRNRWHSSGYARCIFRSGGWQQESRTQTYQHQNLRPLQPESAFLTAPSHVWHIGSLPGVRHALKCLILVKSMVFYDFSEMIHRKAPSFVLSI